MAAPIPDIRIAEDEISKILKSIDISTEELNRVAYFLGSILNGVFPTLDRSTGLKGWCVDDMYPNDSQLSNKKVTLTGNIFWLNGGGDCTNYQVDIARDTTPILYSYKFKNSKGKQILYIGKTYDGWTVNTT